MKGSIICLFIILLVSVNMSIGQQQVISDSTKKVKVAFMRPANSYKVLQVLPSDIYMKNLGFFCSKELQLDKMTKMPIRFRLGSVAYTDKLERKNSFNPAQRLH